MSKLVLIRHGQSIYNLENRFTGWEDVGLTEKGEKEAKEAASLLDGYQFSLAYTSELKRAQKTLKILLDEMSHRDIEIVKNIALNERDYGDLVGQNKAEAAEKFGADMVQIWRRSYDTPPPGGESLKMTADRTIPFFNDVIRTQLKETEGDIIVSAHGNSIRSIVMNLLELSPSEVLKTEIGWCEPWIFTFDGNDTISSFKILSRDSDKSMSSIPESYLSV